ncbi:unnamed protein product [Brachionus calyciflorus]|uniref:RRM domain-containing protein n=1 Tax=Brachionus calyciflorus TaxID=104777 RepID=A0A813T1S9_9BILA|nr:unnamed protein product [Brachionus calyciflorus]
MSTRLIQVTNVSTSVTREQLRALFTNLGRIEDIQLYPESETLSATIAAKVGYVKFSSSEIAQAALNLTSTVFIDRPILISLVRPSSSSSSARIPDESDAVKFCAPLNTNIALLPSGPTWPHNVINRKITIPANGEQTSTTYIETIDSNLTERSLPQYPPLPGTIDPNKAEEIRRTVYVSNLDPRVTFENLYDLFTQIGEIKYIRLTKSFSDIEYEKLGFSQESPIPEGVDIELDSISAYIEFSEQPSVVKALCLNGLKFANREIRVNHSNTSIIIPANSKEQITLDEIKKLKKTTSSHKESQKSESRHRKHRSRRGSASDNSSRSSSEDAVSSEESSPPRKQRKSSKSRSDSKSKTKTSSSSKSKRSRSKEREKDRKEKERDRERDRDKEKSRRSKSRDSRDSKKYKDDKERDNDREKERDRDREKDKSSSHKKDKKEKRRSRERSP